MSSSPIAQAMRDVCEEKGIAYESVLETVEAALAAAYRKDYGERNQNVKVSFDPETVHIAAFDEKEVVTDEFVAAAVKEMEERQQQRLLEEEMRARGEVPPPSAATPSAPGIAPGATVAPNESGGSGEEERVKYNPKVHLALTEARQHEPDAEVGAVIRIPLEVPGSFGRMAAQTAKQVIMQRLREAERDTIFNEWKGHEGELVTGAVQRREGRTVLVDIGPRATGLLREEEQIPTDRYNPGTRLKCLLYTVGRSIRGPEMLLSRTHPDLIRKLFAVEVPEVASGTVEIVGVAREPGSRAKVAVRATEENVDPIGACIGQRGTRVQTVIAELSGEKIDIIQHDDDPKLYIGNAMAPAKVVRIELHEGQHIAVVYVKPEQFSLAIGRSGQNVRLAARLTGWKINVQEAQDGAGGATEGEGAADGTSDENDDASLQQTVVQEEAANAQTAESLKEQGEEVSAPPEYSGEETGNVTEEKE